jgi:hypothetical protein
MYLRVHAKIPCSSVAGIAVCGVLGIVGVVAYVAPAYDSWKKFAANLRALD